MIHRFHKEEKRSLEKWLHRNQTFEIDFVACLLLFYIKVLQKTIALYLLTTPVKVFPFCFKLLSII